MKFRSFRTNGSWLGSKKIDYPRVAVIDEGLLVWRDRGYAVRGGAKP